MDENRIITTSTVDSTPLRARSAGLVRRQAMDMPASTTAATSTQRARSASPIRRR